MTENTKGTVALFFSYLIWGMHPLYWKMLQHISAMEILMHRVLWSVLFAACLVALQRKARTLATLVRTDGKSVLWLAVTGYLVAGNWYLYIWAVNNGQILATSLAYFINPLVSMFFGYLFFGERMHGMQKIAIAIAVFGVALQCWFAGAVPLLSLAIAISFAIYGVIKKRLDVPPEVGLLVETAFVAPVALFFLMRAQATAAAAYPYDMTTNLLLAGTGVITSIPLLLFTFGARRVPLSTVGFVQFLSPTITFTIGTLIYSEPLGASRLATFAVIWTALLIYLFDSFRRAGKRCNNSQTLT